MQPRNNPAAEETSTLAVKIRAGLHRKLKAIAATEDKTLYQLVEDHLEKLAKSRRTAA